MAYEVLARKWRPQIFQDVIGQGHVTQTLINAIKNDRVAHAYLFDGPRGVGKTSVARIMVKAINCEGKGEIIPCNNCWSCKGITNGSAVDIQEIDGASNRGIDEIRDLRENIKYMPASSKYRCYIIDEVHMLTLPAFNALLKTLEEPPSHVKFIFATTESHKVPVTILSRCQRFNFKRISTDLIINHLSNISISEQIEITKPSLTLIAIKAEGSLRDAQSLLDQVVSSCGSKVDEIEIREILGIIDQELMMTLTQAIIDNSPAKCLDIINNLYNAGYDIKEFYKSLMNQFRDLVISLLASRHQLLDLSEDRKEALKSQAKKAGLEKLQYILNYLIFREKDLKFTANPRLFLEATLIKFCNLDSIISFQELLEKIQTLENKITSTLKDGHQKEIAHATSVKPPIPLDEKPGTLEDQTNTLEQGEKTWVDFLSFLSTKNKPMFNIIKDWRLLRLNQDIIEMMRPAKLFSATYFDDRERFEGLSEYCRVFFSRPVKISFIENLQSHAEKKKQIMPRGKNIPVKDKTLSTSTQSLLDTFQGKIVDRT